MKTRILKMTHGFVAQYTLDGYKWASISGFLSTELEASLELVSFVTELKVSAIYTGLVTIK